MDLNFLDNLSDFDLCIYYIDQVILRYEYYLTYTPIYGVIEKHLPYIKLLIDEFKCLKGVIELIKEKKLKNGKH